MKHISILCILLITSVAFAAGWNILDYASPESPVDYPSAEYWANIPELIDSYRETQSADTLNEIKRLIKDNKAEKKVKNDERAGAYWYYSALYFDFKGKENKAIKYFERAYSLNDHLTILNALYDKTGDMQLYITALSNNRGDTRYWNAAVKGYIVHGDLVGAKDLLNEALNYFPSDRNSIMQQITKLDELMRQNTEISPALGKILVSQYITWAEIMLMYHELLGNHPILSGYTKPFIKKAASENRTAENELSAEDIAPYVDDFCSLLHLGTEDNAGFLKPEKRVFREDYAILLLHTFLLAQEMPLDSIDYTGISADISDIDAAHYAYTAVLFATERGLLQLRSDESFGLGEGLSGYAAYIPLYKLSQLLQ